MGTLWLKKFDSISRLLPGRWLRFGGSYSDKYTVCAVRPGGLGDLVALTRACLELETDPCTIFWIGEGRNKAWADYLGLPFASYSNRDFLTEALLGRHQFKTVVNSEQYHGLATLFSCRLTGGTGTHIGFSCNPRADLFDQCVPYGPLNDHQVDGFKALLARAPIAKGSLAQNKFSLPTSTPRAEPYAVVGLGGLDCSYRKLPLERWSALIQIAKSVSDTIYLVGSPGERSFADQLEKVCSFPILNRVGSIPFRECADLIRGAKRFVGIDSGLLNVADFFGVPSTAVFVHWKVKQWGPKASEAKIIDHDQFVRATQK
jgi:hypothetical protein